MKYYASLTHVSYISGKYAIYPHLNATVYISRMLGALDPMHCSIATFRPHACAMLIHSIPASALMDKFYKYIIILCTSN